MSYQAIMLGAVSVMFFFGWCAFEFLNNSRKNEGIGLGLLATSFVMTWLVLNIGIQIAEEEPSIPADVGDAIGYVYVVALVTSLFVFFYFGLVLLFKPVMMAIKRKKLRWGDDEGL